MGEVVDLPKANGTDSSSWTQSPLLEHELSEF